MRTHATAVSVLLLVVCITLFAGSPPDDKTWSVKASYIEACSCELFCQCYFNTSPDKDFCKFNNVIKISSGHVGKVSLDGMKLWMAGNLGGDFTKGMESVVVYFEPGATKEQVDAAMTVVGKLYPVKFGSVTVGSDRLPITWQKNGNNGYAKLGSGEEGEVQLNGVIGGDGKSPVRINNLKYWGADKNNGFVLAKSKHHFHGNGFDYAFEDANGFFIDLESGGTLQ
jgi:hypothetical protein